MISVVDYGIGNTGSVVNMVQHVGGQARLVSHPDELEDAKAIVLPGVGAFDRAMETLNSRSLVEPLTRAVERGALLLGVCLGMQLLFDRSEEGGLPGLGFVPGTVRAFSFSDIERSERPKVPHMGWNTVSAVGEPDLLPDIGEDWRFYFVHGFFATCDDENDVAGVTNHGHSFVSVVQRANVHGTQFHPEKSHKFGKQLFAKFWDLTCSL